MLTRSGLRCKRHEWIPTDGLWDFDGFCVGSTQWKTFSVAVFQWVKRSRGKDIKRGKSIKRFKGIVGREEETYEKAEAYCLELEKKTTT